MSFIRARAACAQTKPPPPRPSVPVRDDLGSTTTPAFPTPPPSNPTTYVPGMLWEVMKLQAKTAHPRVCMCAVISDTSWFLDFLGEGKGGDGLRAMPDPIFIVVCVGFGAALLTLLAAIALDCGVCRGSRAQRLYDSWGQGGGGGGGYDGRGGITRTRSNSRRAPLLDAEIGRGRELSTDVRVCVGGGKGGEGGGSA